MSKRPKTSYLWSYFTISDSEKKVAKCDMCGHKSSFRSTITNLKKHLKSKHPSINLQQTKNQFEESSPMSPPQIELTVSTSNSEVITGFDAPRCPDPSSSPVQSDTKANKKTSYLWSYFTVFDAEQKVASCDLCEQLFSFKTTISNLKKHITSKHPTINLKQEKNELEQSYFVSPPEVTVSKTLNTGNSDVLTLHAPSCPGPCSSQNECDSCLPTIFSKTSASTPLSSTPKSLPKHQKKKLDSLLLRLFIDDYQPFSIVEEPGFKGLVYALDPLYKLPSKETITQILIPAEYEKCLAAARLELTSVESVCLTSDIWTSKKSESYTAVTVHFIKNFKLKSIFLSCEKLPGSPTSESIAAAMKKIVKKFSLSDKVLICVTDNAVSAVEDYLAWEHFPCFAHTLNLIVRDVINGQAILLEKVKSIVAHFKRNTASWDQLATSQKNLGIENPKKLIQAVEKKWNSTFYMVNRFSELEESIKMTLPLINSKNIKSLTSEEWDRCKDMSKILQPFEDVSKQMSGDNYMMGSEVIVFVRGLKSILEKLKSHIKNPEMIQVVNELANSLHTRLRNIEFSKTMGLATFLDPRFKLLLFTDQSAEERIKTHVINLLEKIIGNSAVEPSNNRDPEPMETRDKTGPLSVWDDIDELVTLVTPKGTAKSSAIAEFNRYLEAPYLKRHEDPLLWWGKNHHVYPNMAILVKRKFNVIGSSVPCKSIFSKAGKMIADRRTRLSSKHLQQLLFLNHNSSLI